MKGFMLGSALIILALVFLVFSASTATIGRERDENTLRISVFDRIHDEIKATENGYREIFSSFVRVKISGNNVTFSEALPDKTAPDISASLDNFRRFVEMNSSFSKVSMTGVANDMPLIIEPSGVTYTHPDGYGTKTVRVTNAANVTGYNITVLLNRTGATPIEWENGPYENPAGIPVSIIAGGLTGTDFAYSGTLSKTQMSTIRIMFPENDMFIQIGSSSDPGRLTIDNNNNNQVAFVNTTVAVNSVPFVAFPALTINITAGEYNISRSANVKVA